MNASTARKATSDWMKKAIKDNIEWDTKREMHEARVSTALWRKRGPALVSQIDGYIKKSATNGKHGIWEPSDINPNGDPIIWLNETDRPIHKLLMQYYRDKGFVVE